MPKCTIPDFPYRELVCLLTKCAPTPERMEAGVCMRRSLTCAKVIEMLDRWPKVKSISIVTETQIFFLDPHLMFELSLHDRPFTQEEHICENAISAFSDTQRFDDVERMRAQSKIAHALAGVAYVSLMRTHSMRKVFDRWTNSRKWDSALVIDVFRFYMILGEDGPARDSVDLLTDRIERATKKQISWSDSESDED